MENVTDGSYNTPTPAKVCKKCGGTNFNKSGKCRKCTAARSKKWYALNRAKWLERNKRVARTTRGRFIHGVSLAKHRGVPWTLSFEEYAAKVALPCHYCGHPLNEAGVGLDQVVAGRGYDATSVQCCAACNKAKSDYFTYEEMIVIGAAIKQVKDARMQEVQGDGILLQQQVCTMRETVQQSVEGQQPTSDAGTKETQQNTEAASEPGRPVPPVVEVAGGSGRDRDPLERIIGALRAGERVAFLAWGSSAKGTATEAVADVLRDVLEAMRESLEDSNESR